ncbi:hypothetical protein SNE40_014966 [Patella caerulea]|uniref:Glycerate kinase n=2 Tax=Patella caerulea TaxID=87958 RepID=A0AAN8JM93_PATCE
MRFPYCNQIHLRDLQHISKWLIFKSILTVRDRQICTSAFKWTKLNMANTQTNTATHKHATQMFDSAVSAVLPQHMISEHVQFEAENNILTVDDREYKVNKNVYVVGFGKAVCGMARAVDNILRNHIQAGIISVPIGSVASFKKAGKSEMILTSDTKINVLEGAKNNLPDDNSHQSAKAIHQLVSSLTAKDILLVLISGGGSALLSSPSSSISLEDEMKLTQILSRRAATIQQLNLVRKNIEILKGGGLAIEAHPAKVISLILSDVIGDPLDTIASGPTVPDPSTPKQCINLFEELKVLDHVPSSVIEHLQALVNSPEKQASEQHDWSHVQNVIVGSNTKAALRAAKEATDLGYVSYILSTTLDGEAKEIGSLFVQLTEYICLVYKSKHYGERIPALVELEFEIIKKGIEKSSINELIKAIEMSRNSGLGLCVISGGETTVKIKGSGKGGRNQEMVLSSAIAYGKSLSSNRNLEHFNVHFLSAGTDGQDGPTEAAGAVISAEFIKQAEDKGLDLQEYLDNNDSNTLFSMFTNALVETGFTGTNVMDLQILLVNFTQLNNQ